MLGLQLLDDEPDDDVDTEFDDRGRDGTEVGLFSVEVRLLCLFLPVSLRLSLMAILRSVSWAGGRPGLLLVFPFRLFTSSVFNLSFPPPTASTGELVPDLELFVVLESFISRTGVGVLVSDLRLLLADCASIC